MTGHLLRRACALFAATGSLLATLAPPAALGQSCLCGTAADEFVAARLGLEREWVVQVPFDSAASRLEHVVVGERLVVAQGGDGSMAAIVASSVPGGPRRGTIAWTHHSGAGTAPTEAAGIGPDVVTLARGRGLVALDATTGETRWERALRTVASAPAVPSAGWVYAPLDAGGIQRFPEDPWAKPESEEKPVEGKPATALADPAAGPRQGNPLTPIELSSDGEVDFAPLPYEGRIKIEEKEGENNFPEYEEWEGVVWCTKDGKIAAIDRRPSSQSPMDVTKRVDFDLGSRPSGPLVQYASTFFVTTKAGDVARIAVGRSPVRLTVNPTTDRIKVQGKDKQIRTLDYPVVCWHAVVDEVPEGSPLVGGDTVVVSLGPDGLVAFDAVTGDLLWQESAVGRPVAITGDRVWCVETTGFLVARDLATGARLGRLCLGCFTIPIVNTASERLVLASPGGLVVSLAPRRTVAAQPPVPQPPMPPPPAQPQPAAGDEPVADAP